MTADEVHEDGWIFLTGRIYRSVQISDAVRQGDYCYDRGAYKDRYGRN